MPPTAYRQAQLIARRQERALAAATLRLMLEALERFGARLEAGMAALPGRRAQEVSQNLLDFLFRRLNDDLAAVTASHRVQSFDATLALWDEAMRRLALTEGVTGSLMGQVRLPPITMLNAFDAVNANTTWRTLLQGHVANAAGEARTIVRLGIAEGVSPAELGRRLRRYVVGSEPLQDAVSPDGKIDLRRIPASQRQAARRMQLNAERIAVTELHNARHEAEVQHMVRDPFVEAVQWTLAPDRGMARIPDACDYLASGDYFGLGRGIYPAKAPPVSPHPYDRCSLLPVTRPVSRIREPKPEPPRIRTPRDVRVPGKLTRTARQTQETMAETALRAGESAIRRAA